MLAKWLLVLTCGVLASSFSSGAQAFPFSFHRAQQSWCATVAD